MLNVISYVLKIDLQAFLKDFHLFTALWWFTLEHVAVVGFWWGSIFRQGRIIPVLCRNRVNDHWNMSHDKKLKYVIIKTLQKVYLTMTFKLNPILFYQCYKIKKINHLFPNLSLQASFPVLIPFFVSYTGYSANCSFRDIFSF